MINTYLEVMLQIADAAGEAARRGRAETTYTTVKNKLYQV